MVIAHGQALRVVRGTRRGLLAGDPGSRGTPSERFAARVVRGVRTGVYIDLIDV